MKTSEVLNKAADLIEEKGWGQGSETWIEDYGVGLCLEGAIAAVVGMDARGIQRDEFKACPAYRAVWDHLKDDRRWGPHMHALYNWNDMRRRTAEEVIEVLRAAAVIEAAKESEPAKVSA